jgi:hypothetical protein
LKFKRTPPAVIASVEKDFTPSRGSISNLRFWSENGEGRERLLKEVIQSLEDEGWNYSTDTGWKDWDVQIYGSFWWGVKLRSVTEYHGGPKCLTRVHLGTRMVATTLLINLILLGILLYPQLLALGSDWWLWFPYLIFLGVLFRRAWRLKKRVADLVGAAAARCGLRRMGRRGKIEP